MVVTSKAVADYCQYPEYSVKGLSFIALDLSSVEAHVPRVSLLIRLSKSAYPSPDLSSYQCE
jgi:hypothetical protein